MNFNDKNFQEVLNLAEEARKEQLFNMDKKKPFDIIISPQEVLERMAITAKLSFLVSWFFYQKAVENGELSATEAFKLCEPLCESCDLKICNGDNAGCQNDKLYSKNLCKIKKDSQSLYCRIARIDNMIRNKKSVAM